MLACYLLLNSCWLEMLVNITFYEESNMEKRPLLGILLGDGSGVGSEIVAKLAVANFFEKYCKPIVIGDARILERGFSIIGSSVPVQIISTIEEADWSKGYLYWIRKNLSRRCSFRPVVGIV